MRLSRISLVAFLLGGTGVLAVSVSGSKIREDALDRREAAPEPVSEPEALELEQMPCKPYRTKCHGPFDKSCCERLECRRYDPNIMLHLCLQGDVAKRMARPWPGPIADPEAAPVPQPEPEPEPEPEPKGGRRRPPLRRRKGKKGNGKRSGGNGDEEDKPQSIARSVKREAEPEPEPKGGRRRKGKKEGKGKGSGGDGDEEDKPQPIARSVKREAEPEPEPEPKGGRGRKGRKKGKGKGRGSGDGGRRG